MLAMTFDYMKAISYNDNQYLIIRHRDADHSHVHPLFARFFLFYCELVQIGNNGFHPVTMLNFTVVHFLIR